MNQRTTIATASESGIKSSDVNQRATPPVDTLVPVVVLYEAGAKDGLLSVTVWPQAPAHPEIRGRFLSFGCVPVTVTQSVSGIGNVITKEGERKISFLDDMLQLWMHVRGLVPVQEQTVAATLGDPLASKWFIARTKPLPPRDWLSGLSVGIHSSLGVTEANELKVWVTLKVSYRFLHYALSHFGHLVNDPDNPLVLKSDDVLNRPLTLGPRRDCEDHDAVPEVSLSNVPFPSKFEGGVKDYCLNMLHSVSDFRVGFVK